MECSVGLAELLACPPPAIALIRLNAMNKENLPVTMIESPSLRPVEKGKAKTSKRGYANGIRLREYRGLPRCRENSAAETHQSQSRELACPRFADSFGLQNRSRRGRRSNNSESAAIELGEPERRKTGKKRRPGTAKPPNLEMKSPGKNGRRWAR